MNEDNPPPRISPEEAYFLKAALNANGELYVGYITTKLGMPISVAVQIFTHLQEINFLEKTENILRLTPTGRRWIMENQKSFSYSGTKPWREVPSRFKGNTIKAFQPYAPRKPQLSKKDFGID